MTFIANKDVKVQMYSGQEAESEAAIYTVWEVVRNQRNRSSAARRCS